MKKSLLATAVVSALVAAAGAQATEVKLSGQVNRMIVIPDDAAGDEIQFVDNATSGSRFRITGEHDLGNGMKAGFRLEQQIQANASFNVNGDDVTPSDAGLDPRYQDIYFSGNFGKVSIGKGDSAADGGTEVDHTGTWLITYVNIEDAFFNYDLGNGVNASDAYRSYDAFGRTNRLRYDSPNFGGVAFAVSYGQGSATDFKVTYGGTFGSTKFNAAAFVADGGDRRGDDEVVGASASLLLGMGLNFTLSHSEIEDGAAGSSLDSEGTYFVTISGLLVTAYLQYRRGDSSNF